MQAKPDVRSWKGREKWQSAIKDIRSRRMIRFPNRLPIIPRMVEVPDRSKTRIDNAQLFVAHNSRLDRIDEGNQSQLILAQQAFDDREHGVFAIQGGERMKMPADIRDGEVGLRRSDGESGDPAGFEERDVGCRGVNQFDGIGEGREPGGQPLEGPAARDRIADDRDLGG